MNKKLLITTTVDIRPGKFILFLYKVFSLLTVGILHPFVGIRYFLNMGFKKGINFIKSMSYISMKVINSRFISPWCWIVETHGKQ